MTIQEQAKAAIPMTTEPTTPQEWNQAALEALGWTHKIAAQVGSWRSPPSTNYPKGRYTDFPPDLTSVDGCLKHLVPVMFKKGFRLILSQQDDESWGAIFLKEPAPCAFFRAVDPNEALAIVKAFVRAMKGSQ